MIDRDSLEKALLINIIRNKQWNLLITNNIDESYFSYGNKELYNYIKTYTAKNEYPDIQIVCFKFQIDEISLQEYIQINDLQGLCDELTNIYLQDNIVYELKVLNEHNNEIIKEPRKFIENMGATYNKLQALSFESKSVDLLEGLDDALKVDPNNVIPTGFKELDEQFIGWNRGEDLIGLVARTNQGKSWFGLKFGLNAAMNGERVGIYSGEMSRSSLQDRILCCGKQTYDMTKEESAKFLQSQNLCMKILTPKELRRRARVTDIEEMIVREKLTYVIVDQLSLMEDAPTNAKVPLRERYGNISTDLLDLTIRYNLPIFLLMQSNREGAHTANGPQIDNVAESDAVAQNLTRLLSMRNDNGIVSLSMIKNRYGKVGFTQKYEVDFSINKYKPIEDMNNSSDILKKAKARSLFNGGPF